MAIRTYPSQPSPLGSTVTLDNIDYGAGNTTAQTLRVVVSSDQTAIPVTVAAGALDFGASAAAERVAALLGNASGIADFGAGTVSGQTLRVILPTDQSAIPVTQSGTWNVGITGTVPLPTGAATEATLSALNGKVVQGTLGFTSPGSALSVAASLGNGSGIASFGAGVISSQTLRVVIASDQSNVAVDASQAGSWTVSANQGGSWSVGRTWTLASGTDSIASVQSGVWTVGISGTVPLPTGAATEATLSALNAKVTAVDTGAVVVSSSALPTGAATEATLSAMSAKLPATLGQKAMSASMAVVIASDQSSVSTKEQNVLVPFVFDAISANFSGGTSDVYTYKTGGTGGTTVATVTLTYTDSSKAVLSSVVRT